MLSTQPNASLRLSDQVMQNSAAQLNSSTELTTLTKERMADVIAEQKVFSERMTAMTGKARTDSPRSAEQKSYAEEMRQFIQSELQPQLAEYQRTVNINRWLLIFTLLLAAANFGFVIWSIFGAG